MEGPVRVVTCLGLPLYAAESLGSLGMYEFTVIEE